MDNYYFETTNIYGVTGITWMSGYTEEDARSKLATIYGRINVNPIKIGIVTEPLKPLWEVLDNGEIKYL